MKKIFQEDRRFNILFQYLGKTIKKRQKKNDRIAYSGFTHWLVFLQILRKFKEKSNFRQKNNNDNKSETNITNITQYIEWNR